MSYDVECPYCKHEQDICHDDGQGYEEGTLHEQECGKCEKWFGFYTEISFSYEPLKVPCFQEDVDHEWQPNPSDYWPECQKCKHCGEEKPGPFNENWYEDYRKRRAEATT